MGELALKPTRQCSFITSTGNPCPLPISGRAWLSFGMREGLEHVLDGTPDCRDRAGLAQPRAATLREKRPIGRPAGIPREKNHPLTQGRVLTRQDGIEGWPVQVGHMQVTQNHVIGPLLEL